MTELIASGPLRYLGGSIETFALPMGAFIVIAWVLFYIYRRPHAVPRLKYLRPAHQTALGTREPGTGGLVHLASATAPPPTAAPQAEAEAPAETEARAAVEADASAAAPVESSPEESPGAEHDGTTVEGETS